MADRRLLSGWRARRPCKQLLKSSHAGETKPALRSIGNGLEVGARVTVPVYTGKLGWRWTRQDDIR